MFVKAASWLGKLLLLFDLELLLALLLFWAFAGEFKYPFVVEEIWSEVSELEEVLVLLLLF